MWFDLEMSDLAFIDSAKFRFENKVSLSAPPDKVFEVFADCSSWSKWFPDVVSAKWETDPPHGLGSRRIAKLKGMLTESERMVGRLRSSGQGMGDEGVESVYREVQGMDSDDHLAQEKQGPLDEIFRLNVELREVIQATRTTETDT